MWRKREFWPKKSKTEQVPNSLDPQTDSSASVAWIEAETSKKRGHNFDQKSRKLKKTQIYSIVDSKPDSVASEAWKQTEALKKKDTKTENLANSLSIDSETDSMASSPWEVTERPKKKRTQFWPKPVENWKSRNVDLDRLRNRFCDTSGIMRRSEEAQKL